MAPIFQVSPSKVATWIGIRCRAKFCPHLKLQG